ncbi:MAG TPA: hypothetical protein VLC74_03485 [Rhizomicrobium sp.]|nr:hypothetical protein [Rhizomicrobium sp.]
MTAYPLLHPAARVQSGQRELVHGAAGAWDRRSPPASSLALSSGAQPGADSDWKIIDVPVTGPATDRFLSEVKDVPLKDIEDGRNRFGAPNRNNRRTAMVTSTERHALGDHAPQFVLWKIACMIAFAAIVCAVMLYALYSLALAEMEPALAKGYFIQLDGWVSSGSPHERVETEVVEPCTHLAYVSATPLERLRVLPADRKRLSDRVNACVEITLSRGHTVRNWQGRYETSRICAQSPTDTVIRAVCQRSTMNLRRRALPPQRE